MLPIVGMNVSVQIAEDVLFCLWNHVPSRKGEGAGDKNPISCCEVSKIFDIEYSKLDLVLVM